MTDERRPLWMKVLLIALFVVGITFIAIGTGRIELETSIVSLARTLGDWFFALFAWLKNFGLIKIISLSISIPIILIILIAIIYGMAKIDLLFTIVEEGTAKGIYRFGKLSRAVMSYKDRQMNKNGEVVEGSSVWKSIFGGLKFLGIPFMHSTRMKKFRWTSWV